MERPALEVLVSDAFLQSFHVAVSNAIQCQNQPFRERGLACQRMSLDEKQ